MKPPLEKLGSLITILSGFAFDSKNFDSENGIKLIRIRDVTRGYSETYYNGEFDQKYVVKRGELLVGMDGEFNVARWGSEDALLNQRVCKITVSSDKLDDGYLFHFLPKCLKIIEDATPFVTVKHLSVKTINDILIPLPTISEQKRVAQILNASNEILRKHEEAISLQRKLYQSLYSQLFPN